LASLPSAARNVLPGVCGQRDFRVRVAGLIDRPMLRQMSEQSQADERRKHGAEPGLCAITGCGRAALLLAETVRPLLRRKPKMPLRLDCAPERPQGAGSALMTAGQAVPARGAAPRETRLELARERELCAQQCSGGKRARPDTHPARFQ
jgi:hypothetical protein